MTTEYPYQHQSPSQVGMFEKCPRQYWWRHIKKRTRPPTIAMVRGRGPHEGRDVSMQRKLRGEDQLTQEELADVVRDRVHHDFLEEIDLADEGTREVVRDRTVDTAIDMAQVDAEAFHPTLDPLLIEEEIDWEPPGYGIGIKGIVDLVQTNGEPVDLKTGSPKPAIEYGLQLITYDLLLRSKLGRSSGTARLQGIKGLKAGPKPVETTLEIDDAARQRVLNRYAAMKETVSKGAFPPNPQGWWCSKKWCGYADVCCYWSGRP